MANRAAEVSAAVETVDFSKNKYQVEMQTSMGTIKLDLLPDKAPNHCRNIIGLSRIGFYDGLCFHRVVKGFVIQGGCPDGNGTGGPGFRVDAEFNDLRHDPGVLSMARAQDPNSAGSQFFICVDAAHFLNGQYTGFGRTADEESLNVARAIGKVPTGAGDRPKDKVSIDKVTIHETAF